jgi:hypothetical protein
VRPVTVATVVVRGVALWVAIQAIAGLGTLLQDWQAEEAVKRTQVAVVLVGTVLPLATALLVWANADWLATRLLAGGTHARDAAPWTPTELLRLSIALVGYCILADSVTKLVWYLSVYVSLNAVRSGILGPVTASADLRAQFWDVAGKANFLMTVAKTIVGLVFVLRPALVESYAGRYDRPTVPTADPEADAGVEQRDEADER